jgi:hypothetical protein
VSTSSRLPPSRPSGRARRPADTLAGALRRRGVDDRAATLAAETGIAFFRVAFGRSVGNGNDPDLPALIRESLGEPKVLTTEARRLTTASSQASSSHDDHAEL